jgi:hypothetical protein
MTVVKATITYRYGVKYRFYNSLAPLVAGILAERLDVPPSYSSSPNFTPSATVTMLFTQEEHDPYFDPERFQRVFEEVRASVPRKPAFQTASPEYNAQAKLWRAEAHSKLLEASNGLFI